MRNPPISSRPASSGGWIFVSLPPAPGAWISVSFISFSARASVLLGLEAEFLDADSQFAHLLLEALPIHPDPLRRARDIAARRLERIDEEVALPLAHESFLRLAELQ